MKAQDRYIILKDSLESADIQAKINSLEAQFESEKKQQLINSLNVINQVHVKRNRLVTGLLLASFLALILLTLLIRLRNRTIRQNKKLAEQQQKISELEQQQLKIQLDHKARELSSAALQLINKNEFLYDLKSNLEASDNPKPNLNQMVNQIERNINLDKDWQNFSRHFEAVHPQFFRKLRDKYPVLTANEVRLCAYLAINLNTKEISQMLNVTTAAVDKGRNRLRKKLGILPDINLYDFLNQI